MADRTQPPSMTELKACPVIELLAQLEEIDGNKAGALTLREVGPVGSIFERKFAAVTAALSDNSIAESSGCVWADIGSPCRETPACRVCSPWEVRPCKHPLGHVTSYDICLPAEPDASGVAVIASVYSGKEIAEQIAAAHNTKLREIYLAMRAAGGDR